MSLHLTLDDVHEILRLLDESPYDEMVLETERFKLRLRRTSNGGWTEETTTSAVHDADVVAAEPRNSAAEQEATEAGLAPITAALPGTFYRAPKPGADPFVDTGSTVDDDSVVAIIETMKLMNSVTAGCRGEVVEIRVANGEMVETGQVLMLVRETNA